MNGPHENTDRAEDLRALSVVESTLRPVLSELRLSWVLGLLALLTLLMFGDVLLSGSNTVLSAEGTDGNRELIHWRDFGFTQLKAGHLALWNPHGFCGAPFLGSFQSGLFYPPNIIYLILPLPVAFNWGFVLHVYLAGVFTWLWIRQRGFHSLAALLAAFIYMFSGPFFLRIYAGHQAHLCVMTWAPLVFLAIDQTLRRPALGACLLGIFSLTMALLAGNPQYVYYMSLAAFPYAILEFFRLKSPGRTVVWLGVMCIGAVGLAAVQLFTGLTEQVEGLRGPGLLYPAANMFAFSPENVLTLIAPYFFGDVGAHPYWGRWYPWEMSIFIGMTGFALAIYGLSTGEKAWRRNLLILLVFLTLLALGPVTPVHRFFYLFMPGYNKFRCTAKFLFLIELFLLLPIAAGFDRLLRSGRVGKKWLVMLLLTGGTLVVFSAVIYCSGDAWLRVLLALHGTGQAYLPLAQLQTPAFVAASAVNASRNLLEPAVCCFALVVILVRSQKSSRWLYGVLLLVVVELFSFARASITTFDFSQRVHSGIRDLVRQHPGDYRILNLDNPNSDIAIPAFDLWSDDPGCLRRYGEFLAFTQGQNPDQVTHTIPMHQTHPLFSLLRCRYVFDVGDDGVKASELKDPLPHLLLMGSCEILTNRDRIFSTLAAPGFNVREKVILETAPAHPPEPAGAKGTVQLVEASSDSLLIRAELPAPAILLITDNYSRSWRVRPVDGSAQSVYEIQPADYCLRGISLAKGHHEFRVEYLPSGFVVGKWVSLIFLAGYLGAVGFYWRKRSAA